MLERPGEREPRAEQRDECIAALTRYLADASQRRGLNERTLANYRHDLFEFLAFLRENGVQWLTAVDRPLLRRWLSNLRGRRLSPGSIARRAVEVRAFLRFASRGLDPFAGLRLPRAERSRRPVLTHEQVSRLLSAPDATPMGVRDRAILAVIYAGGLRVAELSALDLRQLDLTGKTIQRWDSAGRPRPAFVGGQAGEALSRYLADARPFLAVPGERALFVSRRGDRLSARAVEHLVGRHGRAAGLVVTPNDLRAACAAHLREGGATAVAVRALLGTTLSNKPRVPGA